MVQDSGKSKALSSDRSPELPLRVSLFVRFVGLDVILLILKRMGGFEESGQCAFFFLICTAIVCLNTLEGCDIKQTPPQQNEIKSSKVADEEYNAGQAACGLGKYQEA